MIPSLPPQNSAVASSAAVHPKLRLTRQLALAIASLALINGATAQVIFSDDFESGALANWTSTAATPSPLEIATPNNAIPVGGAYSAYLNTSADRMHRNIIANNGGTELSGHSIASWYIYDAAGTASRVFNEVRGYALTGLPNGGTTADGALTQLFAAGKYNSVTLPGEVFEGSKYQARVTFGASAGWFNLNAPGAPNRSVGWHKFSIERMVDGTTINFYVDGKLGRTIAGATANSWDTIILGPGLGTTIGDAWIDGFVVMTGSPVITLQPQSHAVVPGGSVTFTVADAGGITYQWKRNGSDIGGATASSYTVDNASGADNGEYTVAVGNGAGTTTSSAAALVVDSITAQPSNQTNCVGTTAQFAVTALGTLPLSYQWYLNETTALTDETNATLVLPNVQVAQAGNYSVVITNIDGAVTSVVAALVVNLNPSVTVNSETICAGGMATLTASTATANPAYLWSPGNSTASSITVSPGSTTIYTVTLTDSDTGCTAAGSGTVTVNPLPTVTVNSVAVCAGGSATLTANTSAANPSYLWSPGGATDASITVSPGATTIYTVTVTDGTTTCANSGSGTVAVTPVPTVAVNSPTICAGNSATLTATTSAANPAYLWSPGGETSASIIVSPAATATYSVMVTDGGAPCPNSGSGTVTVNPVASVTVNSETICAGASATLIATSAATSPSYLWSPGGETTSSITVNPAATTAYSVTVTDGSTGCTNSASGTITVNPLPTLAVNSASICPGGTVTLTASTDAVDAHYLWSPGGATTPSIMVSPVSTTTYTVTVGNGVCSSTASGTVTVTALPSVAVNSETICAGQSATLTATTSAATPSYLWSPGGETSQSILVSPAATTTYTVMITDGSPDCVNSASATVTVNPLPLVTVNSETICVGGLATLTANSGAATPGYLWAPGGETTQSIMVTPGSSTTYTVTVTDGATTCAASGSGTVTVNPLPTVTVNSPTICLGESAVLIATTSAGNPAYLWSPGGETTASITVSPNASTSYSVTVTDGGTSCSASGSGFVTVKLPQTFASGSPISINDNSTASPYPALINVSGLTATVCRVTVTLNNLNHDFPDDIDIVLVGPNGEGVLLMSDVGGGNGISGATLTFDDTAAGSLPDAGQIVSGVFKPTNIGAKSDGFNDLFPAPAPAIRYTTNLASFAGINPNGSWSLYVLDDEAIDAGSIAGGWSIALTTAAPFADVTIAQAGAPNPVAVGSNLTYTVTVANQGPADASGLVLTDTLPAGVDFVSATSPAGSCSHLAGVVTCSFASINAGGSAIVTIVVVPTGAATLANQATVTSSTFDFVTGNNSASASVVVLDPPVITVQPLSQTLCPGGTLSFAVTATGATPFSYQWYKDGGAISGATSAAYSLAGAQPGDSGNYTVGVNNSVGSTLSTVAVGTVNPNPVVTVNSETICLGASATLTATHNAANPSFLWSPGNETTSAITVTPGSTTIYTVRVTDGTTTCFADASGTVTVNPLTVASAIQSFSNVCPGSSVTFSTVATGTPPLSYVWRKDGVAIPGETGDSFTIAAVASTDAGLYTVEVIGGCNSVTNSGTLTVATLPAITAQPQNVTSPMGNSALFSVTVSSPVPLAYQWQLNGVDIDGATSSSLSLSSLSLAQNGGAYRVVVSNCVGTATSTAALLTVTPVAGISFDWNTPGQFTNTPYNVRINDWLHNALPAVLFEVPAGGVGNSGALDLPTGSTVDQSSILSPVNYDFSLSGKTLVASTMVKIKAPANNGRNTQLGFVTATNVYAGTAPGLTGQGIADNNPQSFMTVILQSTAQPALTYQLRLQHRLTTGGITEVTPSATTGNLTAGNWYKVTARFVNIKGAAANTFSVEASLQDMGADGTVPGSIVLSYAPTNIVNADVVNAKNMFLAFRNSREDTGVDLRDTTYAYATAGPVSFVAPPASQTVLQGRQVTLRALVDGEGPYAYQWNKNGSPILGARNWKYIVPPAQLSDTGAEYTVTVTGPANSVTSEPAILTVAADTLAVVSVGSVDGCLVGLRFNQPVDKATAENAANYLVDGVAALQAVLRADGQTVLVTPPAMLSGAFSVSVQNVLDLSGGSVGSGNSANGMVAGLVSLDVNSALPVGTSYSFAPNSFEITGGGADIFSSPDSFRYVYTQKTGDFDVFIRVLSTDVVRAPSKIGLDVRATLDPTSPHVLAAVNPKWPARGLYEGTYRQIPGSGGISWGVPASAVRYPEGWLRFRRTGNTFMRYSSVNGVNWLFDGQISPTPALPETLYLGVAVCAGANGNPLTAEFDNFANFSGYPGATLAITAQPVPSATVVSGGSTNLSVVATVSGAPASGEVSYLWQRSNGAGGWTNMPSAGATNNVLNTGPLFATDTGAEYRVIVKLLGATEVMSTSTTVTVTDTTVPTLTSAAIPATSPREVVLVFSEPVSLATATFVVTNASGASMGVESATFLGLDPRTVLLTTTSTLVAGNYGVVVNGVQDLSNNAIAPNTSRTFSQAFTQPLAPIVVNYFTGLSNAPADITVLTAHVDYLQNNPDLITYSNVFGINAGIAAFPNTLDNYGARIYSYFVPPTSGAYKFYIRGDDFVQFLMNTNAVGSTNRAQAVQQLQLIANNPNYAVANSVTNTLVGGQRYYMELRFKETTGGDGGTVAIRTDNTLPAATEVAPASMFVFPADLSPPTPVIAEIYRGPTGNLIGDLTNAFNAVNVMARLPDIVGYERYFGFNTNFVQGNAITLDNYMGRLYTHFVAPSNGLYRFWMRSDDASQLYMNTNAVNSTDPAGKVLLGQLGAATANYTLVAQNVPLIGGQRYFLETWWKEGGGGDGLTLVVKAQSDASTPPNTEVMPGSLLELPSSFSRLGAVTLTAITPLDPTVNDGTIVTFAPVGISGSPPYTFHWLKNGVPVFGNATTYTPPPLAASDSGAAFTLVVSNLFSRVERSSTVTVNSDLSAPTVLSAEGSVYFDTVLLTFSEPVDLTSATCLPNYRINGLTILGVTFENSRRTRVVLRTTPQTPGTVYTVTINDVRDASSASRVIAPDTMVDFTAWTAGGCGFMVDIFTNIAGTAVANLTADFKYINNLPDEKGYVPSFSFGTSPQTGITVNNFRAAGNLENYGARVSGYFNPPTSGLYRFYIRGDDGTQLFMNTNGAAPSGRVLVARNDGANSSTYENGTGGSASPILSLSQGTAYYAEALMKEGGGGDYVTVAFREIDPLSLAPIGGIPPNTEAASGRLFTAPGNPDTTQFLVTEALPPDVFVIESDSVTLAISATILPANIRPSACYQWQKSEGLSGTFTNIPGAILPAYTFPAAFSDNGAQYRIQASLPGTNATFTTTLHVTRDNTPPRIVSASSLDGNKIGICYNERITINTAVDTFNYTVNGGLNSVLNAEFRPDQKSVVLTIDPPVSGEFTVDVVGVWDLAEIVNEGASGTNGIVQGYTPFDVGAPAGPGSSFSCIPGEIEVIAGGNDIWGTSDVGHLTLTPRSGDFDVHLRVHSLTRAVADNDGITKAGLMVRETTAADSRKLHVLVEPPASVGGRDLHEAGQRPTVGAATAAWAGGNATGTGPAGLPNGWIRIKRVGDLFTAFRSVNGIEWTMTTTQAMAFPSTVLVGLATTAHIPVPSAATTVAEYRDIYIPNPPTILVQPAPLDQVVPLFGSTSYSVTVSNPPNSGLLAYQWLKDGVVILGANGATLNLSGLIAADSGVYAVRVGNDGGATLSSSVTLTVSNALPVVVGESLTTTQNVPALVTVGTLLSNDSDPDGAPLAIVGVNGVCSSLVRASFDRGLPGNGDIYGSALMDSVGGVGNTGVLKLTAALGNQQGAIIFEELSPGAPVAAFSASFNLRIGNASAEPADGFSFNFAGDLPITNPFVTAWPRNAEDGEGTGLSFCIDNYRFAPYPGGGTANTSGMKIRYNGVDVAGIQLATWNRADYVPVSITLALNGALTVMVDGTNVFPGLVIPYVPATGRFGIYARTGGQFQTHWMDDLNITVVNRTPRGGLVSLDEGTGVVTYTPGTDTCGPDSFAYIVSDGQEGGAACGSVAVQVEETTPTPPVIVTCVTNRTLGVTANCQLAIPDLTGELVATDNCSFTVTQVPAPGTLVALGPTVITFTVTDSAALTAVCQATITVEDGQAPVAVCPADITAECQGAGGTAVVYVVGATDNCDANPTVVCTPPSTSVFPAGLTTVNCTATDVSGNVGNCSFKITVVDTTAPAITCPANMIVQCTTGSGAVVNFAVPANDLCQGIIPVVSTPASGSTFPFGVTTVTNVATDSAGNSNVCTFTITVLESPVPSLTIVQQGANIIISWPQTCTPYALESISELGTAAEWEPVTETVETVGTNFQVTISAAAGNEFYRLKKQP
jgi:uncharacterized repeat protein (TIGR01451 family)